MTRSDDGNTSDYWIDLEDERLWRNEVPIALTPKAFAMLRCFLDHSDQLLTKEALLKAVWPGITVAESEVKHFVHELRRGLDDDPKHPTFIQTVHGRGYRFVGNIRIGSRRAPETTPGVNGFEDAGPTALNAEPAIGLFGRNVEFAALTSWLRRAMCEERVVGFVSGEAGIGKTSLVASFLERAAMLPGVLIGIGQCVEHYGTVEPFMPVLEALEGLCKQPLGHAVSRHLVRYAPSWARHIPGALADLDRALKSTDPAAVGSDRMLRQIVLALERPISEGVLILVLEDLHWADPSTLSMIAALARRRVTARLLVIATFRPEDDYGSEYSLRQLTAELAVRGQCAQLPIAALSETDVVQYVRAKLPQSTVEIEQAVYRHTDGNPLFMVNMVAHLLAQDGAAPAGTAPPTTININAVDLGVPDTLRDLIERQFDTLRQEDQSLLEACCVAGARFSAATVAAALDRNVADTEQLCEELCRRGRFLKRWRATEEAEEAAEGRYEFRHALYVDVIYGGLAPEKRMKLHHAVGLRLEHRFGPEAPELAALLALHFERGRDPARAARYLRCAADIALRRCANAEAIELLTRAIDVVRQLPLTPERSQEELALHVSLGAPFAASKSWASPEVEQTFGRAQTLCKELGSSPQVFPTRWGLWAFSVLRARHDTAYAQSCELLELARRSQDSGFLVEGHVAMGLTQMWRGEFETALQHLDDSLDGYDPRLHSAHALDYGQDPRMICLAHKCWLLWWLGYADQAAAASREAVNWARELSHPHSLAFATLFAAVLHQFRGEHAAALKLAEEVVQLSNKHAFGQWSIFAKFFRGRALVALGNVGRGIGGMERSLSAHWRTGSEWGKPLFLTLMAEAYAKGTRRQKSKGPPLLEEALQALDTTNERFYEAEVHRVRGEYAVMAGENKAAEGNFRRALDVADDQNAKSWQLRAATSLAELWRKENREDDACRMLLPVYAGLTEGFRAKDPIKARTLLEKLGC